MYAHVHMHVDGYGKVGFGNTVGSHACSNHVGKTLLKAVHVCVYVHVCTCM